MTILLHTTGNPITREERNRINENWDRIIAGLTEMQYQINFLAGGEEVQKLLEDIHKALDNIAEAQRKTDDLIVITNKAADNADAKAKEAETATQNANIASQKAVEAVNNVKVALADLDLVKQATLTATQNANDATVSATQASVEAKDAAKFSIEETEKAIKDINDTISASLADMTVKVDTSLQNVQVAIEASNKATTDNTQATINAITEAETKVNTALQNADNATERANIAAKGAEQATEAIKGWGTATVWSADTAYERNNVVTENGSTWQATKVNTNSKPSLTNTDWIMLAQRGVDGTGAVSSVNNVLPDENGNVQLDIKQGTVQKVNGKLPNEAGEVTLVASDLGDFSGSLIDDSSVGLQKLTQDVKDAIAAGGNSEEAIKTWAKQLGLGSAFYSRKSIVVNDLASLIAITESGTYRAMGSFLPDSDVAWLLEIDYAYDDVGTSVVKLTATGLSSYVPDLYGEVFTRVFLFYGGGAMGGDTGWVKRVKDVPITWYNATMINGFTGFVKYGKDHSGMVTYQCTSRTLLR